MERLATLPILQNQSQQDNMGGANTQQQWKPNPNDLRADGSLKGKGFLGVMNRIDDPKRVSSEISIGVDWGSGEKEIPTMVPTLDKNEINYLLSNESNYEANPQMWSSIRKKAVEHAKQREAQGFPYFAQENESQKPKQNNTMGGANSQALKDYRKYQQEAVFEKQGTGMTSAEEAAYAPFDNKTSTPNSFGRDAKKVDPASVIKKEDVNMIKKPMSSYDAIDAGLR